MLIQSVSYLFKFQGRRKFNFWALPLPLYVLYHFRSIAATRSRRGAPEVPRGAPCRGAVTCTSRSKVQTPHILIEFLASTCSKSLYQPGNSCLPSAFDSRCQDLVLLENRCQMFFDHYFEFCPRQPWPNLVNVGETLLIRFFPQNWKTHHFLIPVACLCLFVSRGISFLSSWLDLKSCPI